MPSMPRRKPSPMDEENFPTRSPTRDAVEREMQEPGNIRGPTEPIPKRKPPIHDLEDADLGDGGREI